MTDNARKTAATRHSDRESQANRAAIQSRDRNSIASLRTQ